MRFKEPIFYLVSLITLAGCGYDSVSGVILSNNLGGTWRGVLRIETDQCNLQVNSLSEIHEVSVDHDFVTLISTDGRTLQGQVTQGNSFQVSTSDHKPFPMTEVISYSDILDGRATVLIRHVSSGPDGCETDWSGEMNKD